VTFLDVDPLDEDREEVVVSIEANASMAHSAVRLCCALVNDGLGGDLPVDPAGDVAMAAFGGPPGHRDLGPLLEAAPVLRPLARVLAVFLDQSERLPDRDGFGGPLTMVELGQRPAAAALQATVREFADG